MLSIEDMHCMMGKISNNLECHGEQEITEFSIPITGIMLTAQEVNAFLEDPYADRSFFNNKRELQEPMPWCSKTSITLNDRYDGAIATITVSGDQEIEFKDARLNKITLTPKLGGLTQMDFQLQIAPGLGRENLLLQEHQNREIVLCIADAKIALKKKGRQKELPLQQPETIPSEGDNYDHDEADRIAQRNDAERQLGEALRGLEAQQPVDQVAGEGDGDAANDSDGDGEPSSEAEQPARASRRRKGERARAH